MSSPVYPVWAASTQYPKSTQVQALTPPTVFQATAPGQSGATAPPFPAGLCVSVKDGTTGLIWMNVGTVAPITHPIPVPQTPAEFYARMPTFADPTVYPPALVQAYLDAAGILLPACVWGSALGMATLLFVNHNLYLYSQQFPNGPGSAAVPPRGPITWESAGLLAVSYDMAAVLNPDAGWWNYSTWGQNLYRLIQIYGAGPRQLNVPPWGGACLCAFDTAALAASPLAGTIGPGWWNQNPQENVPMGKFLGGTAPPQLNGGI